MLPSMSCFLIKMQPMLWCEKEQGLFSFKQDGHHNRCEIRKFDLLSKKLLTQDAWITGQRKCQSPYTLNHIPVI